MTQSMAAQREVASAATAADSPSGSDWQPLAPLATGECAPWCAHRDGHAADQSVEDPNCYSAELRTELSLYPPATVIGDGIGPDQVTVYAQRAHLDGGADRILVGLVDEMPLEFTPAEARQVIEHMQRLLTRIGGAQ